MAIHPLDIPEVQVFRGAFGRLCSLSAIALLRDNVPRDIVSDGFHGKGTDARTRAIRLQRVNVNHSRDTALHALGKCGFAGPSAGRAVLQAARDARDAVQSEWGSEGGKSTGATFWEPLTIPIKEPSP